MEKPQQTRRTFLIGGASLLACAVAGIALKPLVAEANVLRPPGALPEPEFMARCIKCDRCISVCPTNILEPMGVEEGFVQVRTPKINYADNLCTFCDECHKVCPTDAIGLIDPYRPDKGRIGVAVVREDRCLAFLEVGSCGICIDACPYDALNFDSARRPVVDTAKCNGCGECVRICPANILRSFGGGSVRGIEVVTAKSFADGSVQA